MFILDPGFACFNKFIASGVNPGPDPEAGRGAPATDISHEATLKSADNGISGGYFANNLYILPTADLPTEDPVPIVPKNTAGGGKLETLNLN